MSETFLLWLLLVLMPLGLALAAALVRRERKALRRSLKEGGQGVPRQGDEMVSPMEGGWANNQEALAKFEVVWSKGLHRLRIHEFSRLLTVETKQGKLRALAQRRLRYGSRFTAHLALSPPKTGTTTLHAILAEVPQVAETRSAHFLSMGMSKEFEANTAKIDDPKIYRERRVLLESSRLLRCELQDAGFLDEAGPTPASPLYVLTSIREPVARFLSGEFYRRSRSSRSDLEGLDAVSLRQRFINEMNQIDERAEVLNGERPSQRAGSSLELWFEHEIHQNLGIDLMATPFDSARGWQIYTMPRIRLLMIRQENFSHLREGVGALYGNDPACLPDVRTNEASNRVDFASYAETKRRFRLPKEVLEKVYSSSLIGHLYSEVERIQFIKKWCEE